MPTAPVFVQKCCRSFVLSCGFFVAWLVLLYVVMTSMRAENGLRRAFSTWANGGGGADA